jgi:hypothetical protein
MRDNEQLWSSGGLRRFQTVRCVVTGHRGRFGIDVEIVSPTPGVPGFIDIVMLADGPGHIAPESFPVVGSVIDALTIDYMPGGELRLSARPSDLLS